MPYSGAELHKQIQHVAMAANGDSASTVTEFSTHNEIVDSTINRRFGLCNETIRTAGVDRISEQRQQFRRIAALIRQMVLSLLEHKCKREGTRFVAVNQRGTTKECASSGVSAEKPL